MMKRWGLILLSAALAAILCGCGGAVTYRDGVYTGQSQVYEGDEDGNGDGYGVATVTIQDGKITACEFLTYQTDGTLKDSEYGKQDGEIANSDFYNKAQRAVLASAKYGQQLAETGLLSSVDAITGATISYNEFREAVQDALKQAEQK